MHVAGWLHVPGFEQYEVTFRDNDITGVVLPNRSAKDLKHLVSGGHPASALRCSGAAADAG